MARSRKGLVLLALPVLIAAGSAFGLHGWISEPEAVASPLVRAQELFGAGKYREAERLLVGRPSADAKFLLARVYLQLGLLEDARDLLGEVAFEGDRPEARRLLAKVCLDRGDFARAAPALRRMVQDEPKNVDLLRLLAHAESKSGNQAAALSSLQQALTVAPEDAETARLAAELANELAQAAAKASAANDRDPKSRGHRPSSPTSSHIHPASTKETLYGPRPR